MRQLPKIPDCLAGSLLVGPQVTEVLVYAEGLYRYISDCQDEILDLRDKQSTFLSYIDSKLDAMIESGSSAEELIVLREMSLAFIDLIDERFIRGKS